MSRRAYYFTENEVGALRSVAAAFVDSDEADNDAEGRRFRAALERAIAVIDETRRRARR